ncbi:MAG: hypothetical protein C4294_17355, partial [Nitrospiraceae bacterium]
KVRVHKEAANNRTPVEAQPPAPLLERRAWVLWRYERRNGRLTKVPYRPDGEKASVSDPTTWADWDSVCEAYKSGDFDGIGFVLGDGLCGIDVDWKNLDTADVPPEARAILERFKSYAEWSPSGKGFHVLLFGKLPEAVGKIKNLENGMEIGVYDGSRG